MSKAVVFLFDVDNTLLDNDRVSADLKRFLTDQWEQERQRRYWALFEELRTELGYADYLGALQRYRTEYPRDPNLLAVSEFLVEYYFANRLFPNSLDVLDHVSQWGKRSFSLTAMWSFSRIRFDGRDCLMASMGHVLIYVHKEHELDDVNNAIRRTIMC